MRFERRADPVLLGPAELSLAVRPFSEGRAIERMEPLPGGYCNTTYRFWLSGLRDPFVLRIFAFNPSACSKEAALLSGVHGIIPVPELLYSDEQGEGLEGRPFLITRWVEGISLQELLLDPEHRESALHVARTVGHGLGTLSQFGFPRVGGILPDFTIDSEPADSFRQAIGSALTEGLAGEKLGSRLTASLLRFIDKHALRVECALLPVVLMHADFNASNILLKREGDAWRVSGILDWEFARAGHAVFDFAPMLRDEELRPPGLVDAMARGFLENGGTLPPDWKELARIYDLLNMVEALNTSRSRPNAEQRARKVIEAIIGVGV